MEEELERLQALGVIQPVQFMDWAAHTAPVAKSDSRIRICGDYMIMVNRAMRLEKYPIPRIEELFTSLAGGSVSLNWTSLMPTYRFLWMRSLANT